MSVMPRIVAATAALLAAAIPVGALTVHNTSDKDFTIGVSTGSEQAVYTVPAKGSVDVKEDCSADCAVTGPWGFSHLVPQNAVVESDGLAIVATRMATAEPSAPPAGGLVRQDPAQEVLEAPESTSAAPVAKPAPAVQTRKRAARTKPRRAKQTKKGPAAGSFQMLLQGPAR